MMADGSLPYVIAEAGVNHNGSLERAMALALAAREAGADAVKYQTFIPEQVIMPTAPRAAYQQTGQQDGGMLDMVRPLALSFDQFRQLHNYCGSIGIDFLSTPFDRPSAQFLAGLGLPYLKVSSGDLDNYALLDALADAPSVLILSTGMADLEEIEQTLQFLQGRRHKGVALMHCVSSYPAGIDSANVLAVKTIARRFSLTTGYSDHTTGLAAACAAVALGATLVEKHFTLDKALPGPDHAFSLDPAELKNFVALVKDSARSLGDGDKRCLPAEQELRTLARRSLYAARDLRRGERLGPDDVLAMRPATGLSARHWPALVGQIMRRDLTRFSPFDSSDLTEDA